MEEPQVRPGTDFTPGLSFIDVYLSGDQSNTEAAIIDE